MISDKLLGMRRIFAVIAVVMAAMCAIAQTPQDVMQQVAAKINGSSGLSGNFKVTYPGNSVKGSFKISGRKSQIDIAGMGRQWYDGRTLWNANPRTQEVTVVIPTADELAEANPLAYLDNYASRYNIYFSSRKDASRYLVLLNPKRAGNMDVKAIEVAVNKKTMLPERLVIRMNNDSRSSVTFTGVATGRKFNADEFVFPAAAYKDYETIDLR